MSSLNSHPRTRRFSEVTFRPSRHTKHWKTQHFATSLTFRACGSSFFPHLLIFFLAALLFQLSILSEVRLLNFLRSYICIVRNIPLSWGWIGRCAGLGTNQKPWCLTLTWATWREPSHHMNHELLSGWCSWDRYIGLWNNPGKQTGSHMYHPPKKTSNNIPRGFLLNATVDSQVNDLALW